MNKTAFFCTIAVGILLIASFFIHAFGGTGMIVHLIDKNLIPSSLATALKLGWIMGSIAILLMGVWCFFLAPAIKKGSTLAKAQLFLMGLSLCTIGFAITIIQKEVNHVLIFSLEGLLLVLPSLFVKTEHI